MIIFQAVRGVLEDFIVYGFILGLGGRFLAWLKVGLGFYSVVGYGRDPRDE